MNKADKLKHCRGCTENFYNGNNDMGVKECWNLKSARLVNKVRVGINDRPPWNVPIVKVFGCRRERGIVLMTPEIRDANTREYERCVAREQAETKRAPVTPEASQ